MQDPKTEAEWFRRLCDNPAGTLFGCRLHSLLTPTHSGGILFRLEYVSLQKSPGNLETGAKKHYSSTSNLWWNSSSLRKLKLAGVSGECWVQWGLTFGVISADNFKYPSKVESFHLNSSFYHVSLMVTLPVSDAPRSHIWASGEVPAEVEAVRVQEHRPAGRRRLQEVLVLSKSLQLPRSFRIRALSVRQVTL